MPCGWRGPADAPLHAPPRPPHPRSTHVNIISGSNGSGKSAGLQAMQAALGAKAKDTGRGDNFRELVRTGCSEAKVKVRAPRRTGRAPRAAAERRAQQ